LTQCPDCHHSVDIDLSQEPKIIQQTEIVQVSIDIEEHRAHAYWCNNCGQHHSAEFPAEVVKEGLFKVQLTSFVAYMKNVCHCSYSNIRKYIRDVLHLKVSRGNLSKLIQKVSCSLAGSYEEFLRIIPYATEINIDETGHTVNGDKYWTLAFKTDLYMLFKIEKSRGSQVLIEILGKEFNGILGYDHFSAYIKYMKVFNVIVQFCTAHLIRDFKYLSSLTDEETKIYGEKLLSSVKNLFRIIHKKVNAETSSRQAMSEKNFIAALTQAIEKIIKIAINDLPFFINDEGKVVNKMVNRFTDNSKAYFDFITSPGVDPTNKTAEQDIRFIVIDRLVTQGTQSENGRKANIRLWTVIAIYTLQEKVLLNLY